MQIAKEKIKLQMKARGLKAPYLAEKYSISLASIRSVLYGNSLNPSFKILNAFSQELGLTIEELYENTYSNKPDPAKEEIFQEISIYNRILNKINDIANRRSYNLTNDYKKLVADAIFRISMENSSPLNSLNTKEELNETLIDWAISRKSHSQ